MQNKIKFIIGAIAAVAFISAIFIFSVTKRSQENLPQAQILEPENLLTAENSSVSDSAIENELVEIIPAVWNEENDIELQDEQFFNDKDLLALDSLNFEDVRDVKIYGNRMLMATAAGVIEFFPADSSFILYSFPQGLENYDCYQILEVDHDLYVGTAQGVYLISGEGFAMRIWDEINTKVLTLKYYEPHFYVGTEKFGLFQVYEDKIMPLLVGKTVIDLTLNEFGIFAATKEDGLLFHNGDTWKKRELLADSSAFDTTNCLLSAFHRLWVGTSKGVYVFDGGRWDLINEEDNLFDPNVTAIDRGKNFIYFGTANSGLFSYFNGGLSPLDWSEGSQISALDVSAGRYLVGTNRDGATLKTPKRLLNIQEMLREVSLMAFYY